MGAVSIAGPVKVRPALPVPYSPETRGHFLDIFWQFFLGGRFITGQGTVQTTITAPTTVGATSITVADATGIVAGMPLVLFTLTDGVYSAYQVVLVSSVAGTTINLSHTVNQVFASGTACYGVWLNDSHLNANALLAQHIVDARQRPVLGGNNLLPLVANTGFTVGEFPTGGNGSQGVSPPTGWLAIGTAQFLQTDWSNNTAVFNHNGKSARTGTHSVQIKWMSSATAGMSLAAAVPVSAGQRITVIAHCKPPGAANSRIDVTDFTDSTKVLATKTYTLGEVSKIGIPAALSFTVPAGVTGIDIRFIGVVGDLIVSDVRVIRSRQDTDQNRYVLEDPGQRPIVALGDSWGLGLCGTAGRNDAPGSGTIQHALALRLGRTPVFYNQSVTGQTLAQQLARFATDVAPYEPKYLIHASAFMNDSGVALVTLKEQVAELIDRCRRHGIIPILLGGANQNSAIAAMSTLNDWARAGMDSNIDYVPYVPV